MQSIISRSLHKNGRVPDRSEPPEVHLEQGWLAHGHGVRVSGGCLILTLQDDEREWTMRLSKLETLELAYQLSASVNMGHPVRMAWDEKIEQRS